MISHKYKCIFIHNRKAAGTTVKGLFSDDPELTGELNNGLCDSSWFTLRKQYGDYLSFVVVRNPYDRFVSAWQYLRSIRDVRLEELMSNLPSEYLFGSALRIGAPMHIRKRYLRRILTIGRSSGVLTRLPSYGGFKRFLHLLGHDYRHLTREQSDLFIDQSGQHHVDYMVRFEHLESDLAQVCEALGKRLERLPVSKAGVRPRYQQCFDKNTARKLRERYPRDTTLLDYRFDEA